jgi:hypothetical protein
MDSCESFTRIGTRTVGKAIETDLECMCDEKRSFSRKNC